MSNLDQTATTTETTETPQASPPAEKSRQMAFVVLDTGVIRATFGEGIEPLDLNPAEVPEALYVYAVAEGIIARLRGYTSKLEGNTRTPAGLRERVALGMTNIKAGIWKIERTSDGSTDYPIEVEAAFIFRQMRAKAKNEEFSGTLAEAAEHWAKLTDDPKGPDGKPLMDESGNKILGEKSQVKALPRYQLAMAEVKEARAKAKREKLLKEVEASEGDSANF